MSSEVLPELTPPALLDEVRTMAPEAWRALEPHPLAELIPSMAPKEYGRLCADIEAHGLLEPLTLYEGRILDGRHRWRALCDLSGEEALAYVFSLNLHRRHLTYEQKVCLGLDLKRFFQETIRPGAPEGNRNAAKSPPANNPGNPASIPGAGPLPQARDRAAAQPLSFPLR